MSSRLHSSPDAAAPKLAVVTGANSGLGLETTRALADRGFRVVMASRKLDRTTAAMQRLLVQEPRRELRAAQLDLGDLDSVARFATTLGNETRALDLLVNNAGVMGVPRLATRQGFEMHMGVNHLGHVALTAGLFELLQNASCARVVVVSSMSHRLGYLRPDRLGEPLAHSHPPERPYHWMAAYAASKLANLMFGLAFDRRLQASSSKVRCTVAHPGYARSHLGQAGAAGSNAALKARFFRLGNRVLAQSAQAGAACTLRAATDPNLRGGEFIGPTGWLGLRGDPGQVSAARRARDHRQQARVWDRSLAATQARFVDIP